MDLFPNSTWVPYKNEHQPNNVHIRFISLISLFLWGNLAVVQVHAAYPQHSRHKSRPVGSRIYQNYIAWASIASQTRLWWGLWKGGQTNFFLRCLVSISPTSQAVRGEVHPILLYCFCFTVTLTWRQCEWNNGGSYCSSSKHMHHIFTFCFLYEQKSGII